MYKNFDRLYSNIKEKFDKIGIAFAILFTLYSWTAMPLPGADGNIPLDISSQFLHNRRRRSYL